MLGWAKASHAKKRVLRQRQSGFTLIELVVVIVILGVLGAIALPKFANMQAQARIAKMQGAMGAMRSASVLSHGLMMANGYKAGYTGNPTNPDINVEGVDVEYVNGYPSAVSIAGLAGITSPDYVIGSVGGSEGAQTISIKPDANHPNCVIVYNEAAAPVGNPLVYSQPTFNVAGLTVANCE